MERESTELEIRLMHQERTIQDLNDIVCRQELAIEHLERELRMVKEQVKLLLPSLVRPAGEEEAPPHY